MHTVADTLARLLDRCRATHEAGLVEIEQRNQRFAEALVRKAAAGGVRRAEFLDAVQFLAVALPDETADEIAARRRGFAAGLLAGVCAVAAR